MYCFYPVHVPPRMSNISGKWVQQSYEVSEVSAPATAMQKRKSRAPLYPIVRNVMRSALSEWIYPSRRRPSEPFSCKISSGISNKREPFGGGGWIPLTFVALLNSYILAIVLEGAWTLCLYDWDWLVLESLGSDSYIVCERSWAYTRSLSSINHFPHSVSLSRALQV